MIAVLPIFINEEQAVWENARGSRQIIKVLQTILFSEQFSEINVISDEAWIIGLLDEYPTIPFLTPKMRKHDANTFFPEGTRRAWRKLCYKYGVRNTDLAFFSFRNPFLATRHVNDTLEEYQRSYLPCTISLKRASDHPIQMDCNFRLIEAGVFLFFCQNLSIEKNGSDIYRFTKPFSFDWQRCGIFGANNKDRFLRITKHFSVSFKSANSKNKVDESEKNAPIWEYISSQSARIGINCELIKRFQDSNRQVKSTKTPVGIWLKPDFKSINCLAIDSEKGYLNLYFDDASHQYQYCILTLTGFQLDENVKNQSEVQIPNNEALPVAIKFDWIKYNGAIVTIKKPIGKGWYDFYTSYPDYEPLWHTDDGGDKVNSKAGGKMTGRQDFPHVYIPDHNIAVMHSDMVDKLLTKTDPNLICGSFIDETSLQIHSELDWMRADAIIKAKKEVHE